ncbi:MAG: hypothetical protein R2697_14045 [Ilumatobacteraceae bacterium]
MNRRIKRYLAALAAVLIAIVWAFPVYWMINSSFLTPLTISASSRRSFPSAAPCRTTARSPPRRRSSRRSRCRSWSSPSHSSSASRSRRSPLAISRFRFKGRKTFVLTIILVQMLRPRRCSSPSTR